MKRWAHKQTGFTIVELLIVIVVIAILAAITVVAYNGIQRRAQISQFSSALNSYVKGVNAYYTTNNNTLPSASTACFDGTACWSGVSTAQSQSLRTELLKSMGTLPNFPNDSFIALLANGTVGSYTGAYILYQYPDTGDCLTVAGARILNQTGTDIKTCRAALNL
jgi:prepilin-type N-terminal cleavage/methylation domain-containing protein